jgi:hypothetical protein
VTRSLAAAVRSSAAVTRSSAVAVCSSAVAAGNRRDLTGPEFQGIHLRRGTRAAALTGRNTVGEADSLSRSRSRCPHLFWTSSTACRWRCRRAWRKLHQRSGTGSAPREQPGKARQAVGIPALVVANLPAEDIRTTVVAVAPAEGIPTLVEVEPLAGGIRRPAVVAPRIPTQVVAGPPARTRPRRSAGSRPAIRSAARTGSCHRPLAGAPRPGHPAPSGSARPRAGPGLGWARLAGQPAPATAPRDSGHPDRGRAEQAADSPERSAREEVPLQGTAAEELPETTPGPPAVAKPRATVRRSPDSSWPE